MKVFVSHLKIGVCMWADVESNIDYLNFGEVSSLAVDILKSENMLPVSIGIFGNWELGNHHYLKL